MIARIGKALRRLRYEYDDDLPHIINDTRAIQQGGIHWKLTQASELLS